eukprot:6020276-Amphidinium_carterae.1
MGLLSSWAFHQLDSLRRALLLWWGCGRCRALRQAALLKTCAIQQGGLAGSARRTVYTTMPRGDAPYYGPFTLLAESALNKA